MLGEKLRDAPPPPSFTAALNGINWTNLGSLDNRPFRPEVFEIEGAKKREEREIKMRLVELQDLEVPYIEDDETREGVDYIFNREQAIRNEMVRQESYETALSGF